MELPLTIESLLKIIANKDERFAEKCREEIVTSFNPEDRDFWFNTSAWLKQGLQAINYSKAVKEKYNLTVLIDSVDPGKFDLKTHLQQLLNHVITVQIEADIPILARKYSQLIYIDEFCDIDHAKWFDYFVNKYFKGRLGNTISQFWEFSSKFCEPSYLLKGNHLEIAFEIFNRELAKHAEADLSVQHDLTEVDPYQFEKLCCEILANAGWVSRTTKGSNDQGVDVIAEKDSVRLAIQCKMYNTSVTNKAVQEIYAGCVFYDCHVAMVVTNSDFTVSARQLAGKLNVVLVNFNELESVANKVYSAIRQ